MGAELSTVVATEAVKSIAGKVFAADQVMKDIGVSTKFIAKAVDTMANLAYQEKFPDHVIHLCSKTKSVILASVTRQDHTTLLCITPVPNRSLLSKTGYKAGWNSLDASTI
jgi:hypothetical protein